jgi:hypothetical protein
MAAIFVPRMTNNQSGYRIKELNGKMAAIFVPRMTDIQSRYRIKMAAIFVVWLSKSGYRPKRPCDN